MSPTSLRWHIGTDNESYERNAAPTLAQIDIIHYKITAASEKL